MATETKPTPSQICLDTATDQAKGNAGVNKSATSTVSITNKTTAADASDNGAVKTTTVKDAVTVTICNETGEPEAAEGGCGSCA